MRDSISISDYECSGSCHLQRPQAAAVPPAPHWGNGWRMRLLINARCVHRIETEFQFRFFALILHYAALKFLQSLIN